MLLRVVELILILSFAKISGTHFSVNSILQTLKMFESRGMKRSKLLLTNQTLYACSHRGYKVF